MIRKYISVQFEFSTEVKSAENNKMQDIEEYTMRINSQLRVAIGINHGTSGNFQLFMIDLLESKKIIDLNSKLQVDLMSSTRNSQIDNMEWSGPLQS